MQINKKRLKSLVGKHVYVMTSQGQILEGNLHKFNHDKIYLRSNAKSVSTSAFITPLVLFDLLAIEEASFFFRRPLFF
jgi:hypothetical protein